MGRFVLKNYDRSKPFASFLPALGGEYGIPMWAFYVNRGQGMAAFGLESKEHPLMEFEPANIAYAVRSLISMPRRKCVWLLSNLLKVFFSNFDALPKLAMIG
ncbi:unnamed protein product [Phaeothamnion confervicola]